MHSSYGGSRIIKTRQDDLRKRLVGLPKYILFTNGLTGSKAKSNSIFLKVYKIIEFEREE